MRHYFVNHQFAARIQKHYLWNYLRKPKDLGIRHVVAQLQKINSLLPYLPQSSNSKLPEDKLVEIDLWLIPVGWKCTIMCANFKPLKHFMEELVEYLKGVKCSETKNPTEINNRNNNNSSGLKKTKKASVSMMRTKSPKMSWTTMQAPKKAASIASSAR
eukprot:8234713-Ditylum_brightwellii.AAC.1